MTAWSAAKLSAGDAEDPDAAGCPAVRFVSVLLFSCLTSRIMRLRRSVQCCSSCALTTGERSRAPRPQPIVWLPFCRKGTLLRPANIGKFDEQIVELTTYSTLPSKHAVYEAKLYDDEQYFMGNELTPASHVRFGTQYPTH